MTQRNKVVPINFQTDTGAVVQGPPHGGDWLPASRGRYKIMNATVVVWRTLVVQLSPLNFGQAEKSPDGH